MAPEDEPAIVARPTSRVPEEPTDPLWSQAPATPVLLLPQRMTTPNGGGAVQNVDVRALHDGGTLAVLLSWKSTAADTAVGINRFRDACAVMFPADPDDLPAITMGEAGKPVVVWQWKPDWESPEAQETARKARYPEYGDFYNPANEALFREVGDRPRDERANVLVAEGFGTLTRTHDPDLQVRSRFADGTWHVLFRHPMPGTYPSIRPGWRGAMNFAVWDGGSEEVGARKSISLQWQSFEIEATGAQSLAAVAGASPLALAGGLTAAGIAWAIRRRMALAKETPSAGETRAAE